MESSIPSAAAATLEALVGAAGMAEDSEIMAAQMRRAVSILSVPAAPSGSLFEREPSSHLSALSRLAPGDES